MTMFTYQRAERSAGSKPRSVADGVSRSARSATQIAANGRPIQRKLNVEGKPVNVLPDWVEKGQHPAVVQILSNWVEGPGLTFNFGSWLEAIDKAKLMLSLAPDLHAMPGRTMLDRVEAEPHLNEAEIVNAAAARFSGRISSVPRTLIFDNPEAKAGAFTAILAGIQNDVQQFLDQIAPGYKCLVRFFVTDANAGKTHPGLNSWAFLRQQQGQEVDSGMSRADVALSHMLYGHDVDEKSDPSGKSASTQEKVISNSPMVSTTENVGNLLRADSPFNKARTTALAEGSARNEAIATGSKLRPQGLAKGGLLKHVLRPPAPDKGKEREKDMGKGKERAKEEEKSKEKTSSSRAEGRHVSDRIVFLTHGHVSEGSARVLPDIAVATHIAFLVLPPHRLNHPPADTPRESCCILESEVTVFAPDVDLMRWAIGTVNNRLPALTGRHPQSQPPKFPGQGRRLGNK